jgi:glycine cleavage system T protein
MLKRSRLHKVQQAEGADFIEHRGWEIPQKFSSVRDEYETLKSSVGLIGLPPSGLIEVTGNDRVRFLHGMLTNDIKALQSGQGCYAALLTAQGRIVADVRVYCLEQSFLLMVEPDLREKVTAGLGKYIIGDQVQLLDQSEELSLLSVQGPRSTELLSLISSQTPSSYKPFDHFKTEVAGREVRVCRVDRISKGGYDFIPYEKDLPELWDFILNKEKPLGGKPVGISALNTHRIEDGIPWYGFDFDETNLPLEAGLENAISYTKGCYIGQEIVARATYRGHLNRRLSGLLLSGDNPVSKGDKIFKEETEVGWVTSSVYSMTLQSAIAMGYLRREVMSPGTTVRVEHAGSSMAGQVTTLPFEKGSL